MKLLQTKFNSDYCRLLSILFKVTSLPNYFDPYLRQVQLMIYNHGLKFTVVRLKEIHNIATKIVMDRPFTALSWSKSNNKEVPKILWILMPLLLSEDDLWRRCALSITACYKAIILPADQGTSEISDAPRSGFSLDWEPFLLGWVRRFRPGNLSWDGQLHESTKTGPNGPTLVNSHIDLVSVLNDKEVWNNLLEYNRVSNSGFLRYLITSAKRVQSLGIIPGLHSKLVLLQEGGGKTRTIAMADYFTQESLKSLHKDLMKHLRSMRTDGTYDQGHLASVMKQATLENKPIFCFDLKNATDRFPVKLQEDLLSALYGKTIGSAWRKLVTGRSFEHPSGVIRYGAGQPMGILSSWAAFALTHHAIIQYCAKLEGINSFKDYVVLGDDVAIFHEGTAEQYQNLMAKLGVEISLAKSYIWRVNDSFKPSGEIAKRIFMDGKEFTPLPYDLLSTFLKLPHKEVITLRISMENIGIHLDKSQLVTLARKFCRKGEMLMLLVLGQAPIGLLGRARYAFEASCEVLNGPWSKFDKRQVYGELAPILIKELELKQAKIPDIHTKLFDGVWDGFKDFRGLQLTSTVLGLGSLDMNQIHPLVVVINNRLEGLWEVDSLIERLQDPMNIESITWDDLYASDFSLTETYMPRIRLRSRVQTSVLYKLYRQLITVYGLNNDVELLM